MWNEMFTLQVPLLEKVLRATLGYLLIMVLVRLSGKRGLASMNTLDFVVVFLLAGVVEDATVGDDNSLVGGAVSAVTLVVVNSLVNRLSDTSEVARRLLQGRSTTVIEHGEVVQPALRRLGLRESELDHAIRSQNGDGLDEIEHGKLTPSGQIVVTLKAEEQSATKADVTALAGRLDRIEALLSKG